MLFYPFEEHFRLAAVTEGSRSRNLFGRESGRDLIGFKGFWQGKIINKMAE